MLFRSQAQKAMAKADNKMAQLSEELTLQQINYQADAVYWNASSSEAMYKASEEYKDIVQQQYQVIEERFNDGLTSRSDLLMIATRLQEAELQLIGARQNKEIALQALNILCGRDPKTPEEGICPIGAVCENIKPLDLEEVLERRPDYKTMDVNIEKMEAARKASISKYNPQLSAYVAGGWQTAQPHMGADTKFIPIAGMNLNIPILRWGERGQTSRQQKANITIQELQKSYVADNISQELNASLTKVEQSDNMVSTAQKNMLLAQENLELMTFSYNEGRASIVEVLSAQLSWTQANNNLINAYLSNKMAVAEYRRTIAE